MKKLVKYKGFTLTETIVSIVIIGVIAALTIPALILSHEETKLRSSAKTSYLLLKSAIIKMSAEKKLPDFSASGTSEDVRTSFCTQLNCLETGEFKDLFGTYYYWYNSSDGFDYSAETAPSALISNGMALRFHNYSNDCTYTRGSLDTICAYIDVDINSSKSSNMFGKDFINFRLIKENGNYIIIPAGSKGDGYTCESPGTSWPDSLGCTTNYIMDKDLP